MSFWKNIVNFLEDDKNERVLLSSKREAAPVGVVSEVIRGATGYPKEVEAIHREFFTASEKILAEAKAILAEHENKGKVVDKGRRLAKLGFSGTKEAKQTAKIEKEKMQAKYKAEKVQYYTVNYPNHKFITKEMVEIICNKYNLVCGQTYQYTGFVPEKNLTEIENFKLNDKDTEIKVDLGYASYGGYHHKISLQEFKIEHSKTEDLEHLIETLLNHGTTYVEDKRYYFNSKDFMICAPEKDMNMDGYEKDGVFLKKKAIPDPIVLCPVDGGYLIVTAWGDEASDPLVLPNNIN